MEFIGNPEKLLEKSLLKPVEPETLPIDIGQSPLMGAEAVEQLADIAEELRGDVVSRAEDRDLPYVGAEDADLLAIVVRTSFV